MNERLLAEQLDQLVAARPGQDQAIDLFVDIVRTAWRLGRSLRTLGDRTK